MRAILYTLIVLAVGVTQGAAQSLPPEPIRYADSILYNGKVLTTDKNFTIAQAATPSSDIADVVFQLFEDERYKNITVMLEGFQGWEKRKFPVETGRR